MKRFGICSAIPGHEEPGEEVLALVAAYLAVFSRYWERVCTLRLAAAVFGGLALLISPMLVLSSKQIGWTAVLAISAVLCIICLVRLALERLGRPRIIQIAKAYWPIEVVALGKRKAVVCNARRAGKPVTWFNWNSGSTTAVMQAACASVSSLETEKKFASDLVLTLEHLRAVHDAGVRSPIIERDAGIFDQTVGLLRQCNSLDNHRSRPVANLLQPILPGDRGNSSGCELVVRRLARFCSESPSYLSSLSYISDSTTTKVRQATVDLQDELPDHKQLAPTLGGLAKYRRASTSVMEEAERLWQPVLEMLQEEKTPYDAEIHAQWKRESDNIKKAYRDAIGRCEFDVQMALGRITEKQMSLQEQLMFTRMELENSKAVVGDQQTALGEDRRKALHLQELLADVNRQMSQEGADIASLQVTLTSLEIRYQTTVSRIESLGRRLSEERNRFSTLRAKVAHLEGMIEAQEYYAKQTQDTYRKRIEELRKREGEDLAELRSEIHGELDVLWRTRAELQKAQKALEFVLNHRDPGDAMEMIHKACSEDRDIEQAVIQFKIHALEEVDKRINSETRRITRVIRTARKKLSSSLVDLDDIKIDAGQFCLPIWLVLYNAKRNGDLRYRVLGPQMQFKMMPDKPLGLSRLEFWTTYRELLDEMENDIGDSLEYFLDFAKGHDFRYQVPRFTSVVMPKFKALREAGLIGKSLVDLVTQDIGKQLLL